MNRCMKCALYIVTGQNIKDNDTDPAIVLYVRPLDHHGGLK